MAPSRETWLCIALLAAVIGASVPERAFPDSYIRGSVLFDRPKDTGFLDDDCSTADDRYACETGIDGDFETMTGLELGLGYAMMPAFRLEAALQYRPEFSFKGQADISLQDDFLPLNLTAERDFTADLTVWSAMLSAYLDIPIPGLGLLRHTPLSPFVGIGGGVSRIEIGDADFGGSQLESQASRLLLPGDHQFSFSWMLSAGIAVSLANWTVDVAWRYTDLGGIESATGIAEDVCRLAGCNLPDIDLPLASTLGELRSHGLTLSLRYAF